MASLILHSLTLILLSCSFAFPLGSNTGDAALNNRNHLVDQKHRQFRYPAHSDVDTNGKFLRVILLKDIITSCNYLNTVLGFLSLLGLLYLINFQTPPHLDMTRNASGHLIEVFGVGVSLLEWLSRVLNFKYIFLQDNIYTVGDSPAGKGLMSAIVEGRAEIILGSVAMINDRQQNLSFPYPFVFGKYGFIIPMPSAQSDIVAVWKPFQYQIWIGLLVSLFATTFFLQGINYSINAIYKEKATKTIRTNRGVYVEDLLQVLKYVIGVLFSQGTTVQSETAANQKLAIRILAGAWCLTCFVLVSAYSNVLISFVTSPNYKPLVNSIYDFPKNPQVKITVTRGLSPDLFFSVKNMQKLGN